MIINLIPHSMTLIGGDGFKLELLACKTPARCTEIDESVGVYADLGDHHYIPVIHREYSETYDLPPPQDGILYIVSMIVRQANPDRSDLASPGTLVRDDDGNIIGCTSLVKTRRNITIAD